MPLFGFQNDWCNWVEKAISDLDSGIKVRDIACAYVKCKCTLSNDNALQSKDIITSFFCLCSLHLHIRHHPSRSSWEGKTWRVQDLHDEVRSHGSKRWEVNFKIC